MSFKNCPWLGILSVLWIACKTSHPVIRLGGYSFEFEGKHYHIESVTPNYVEGYNIITRRDGDILLFRAVDKEQDGILDELTVGNMSLEQAQKIYQAGILEGEERGYIRKRTFAREYRTSIGGDRFILATYILALGDIYNKLFYYEIMRGVEVEILDLQADGIIDRVENGNKDLGVYQTIYRDIIDRGLRYGHVQLINGQYIVAE
ncbi:hypothetical protein JW824_02585 [bacterium]|nr:hypothetical protein [bacterium]RQV93290.1 MAG: hypothetical protein EH221_09980 [bacterium]